ncbi:MAG: aminotransferase class I/II-fold pyridoxal phosphate-dependent enzyme [Actinobacteria bacterium]|nr:aminotransferase class I/II-fold pyridoxal phosphate-dependent enzyme [Actinomycetota bacterium]
MSTSDSLHAETVAIRAGREHNDGALAPTLVPTTTFVTETVEEARAMALGAGASRFYSRYGNPTVAGFEDAVASLEGAEAARAFASGMGAVSAVVLGLCSTGDHIVTQRQLYAGTQMLLQMVCPRFGIDVTFVDCTEPGAFASAVVPGKTTLVLAETPANPKLDLVDLNEIGAISGPITVVDSTFATPLGQRPLDHGADLVLHSATKALAGHNDATLGVVAGARELIEWLWSFAVLQGANASPFDAMNGLRGIRTLAVRLRQQSDGAQHLAEALESRADVSEVRYPGLDSHPQRALARRQMALMGGLLSFDVAGGRDAGRRFVEGVEVAQLATSLGGPETLVTHPASTTHVNLTPDELAANGIGPGTVRVSVGLEHPDDLVADFFGALDLAERGN